MNQKKQFTNVILESPFAHEGKFARNIAYARACMKHCLNNSMAPFASHLLYTQCGVLDDLNPSERELGIDAGLSWGAGAKKTVVFVDLGISEGMKYGIQRAKDEGREVEIHHLPDFDKWLKEYNESESSSDAATSCASEQYVK